MRTKFPCLPWTRPRERKSPRRPADLIDEALFADLDERMRKTRGSECRGETNKSAMKRAFGLDEAGIHRYFEFRSAGVPHLDAVRLAR